MSFSWLTLPFWQDLEHPEAWAALAGGFLTALFTFLSVGFAAYLTFIYTRKHSRDAHNTEVKVDRLKREIDSLEKVWELLAYMSFRESDQAIIRWRQNKGRESPKTYSFHLGKLREFIFRKIPDIFYHQHAGLHLSKELKALIFEYCSSMMGLVMRYENSEDVTDESIIEIKNKKLIEKLQQTYEKMNEDLRTELEERYKEMLNGHKK